MLPLRSAQFSSHDGFIIHGELAGVARLQVGGQYHTGIAFDAGHLGLTFWKPICAASPKLRDKKLVPKVSMIRAADRANLK
jgi:hypothetical protein